MAKLPWFPFYAFDFLQDERVQLMTNEQVGMYVKLLCHQWIEGSIPAESSSALAVLKLGFGDEHEMPDYEQVVRDCFHPCPTKPGRLVNARLERIRLEQELISEQKQEAGRKGGIAKARLAELEHRYDSASSRRLAKPSKSESEIKSESEREKEKEKEKKDAQPRKLSDVEFLDSLKQNVAYAHLDVRRELGKMDAWLSTHPGRQKTRKFIVNWLNKLDTPLPIGIPPKPPKTDPIGRNSWDQAYGDLIAHIGKRMP